MPATIRMPPQSFQRNTTDPFAGTARRAPTRALPSGSQAILRIDRPPERVFPDVPSQRIELLVASYALLEKAFLPDRALMHMAQHIGFPRYRRLESSYCRRQRACCRFSKLLRRRDTARRVRADIRYPENNVNVVRHHNASVQTHVLPQRLCLSQFMRHKVTKVVGNHAPSRHFSKDTAPSARAYGYEVSTRRLVIISGQAR